MLVELSLGKTDKVVTGYLLVNSGIITTILEEYRLRRPDDYLRLPYIKNVYIPLVCSKKRVNCVLGNLSSGTNSSSDQYHSPVSNTVRTYVLIDTEIFDTRLVNVVVITYVARFEENFLKVRVRK